MASSLLDIQRTAATVPRPSNATTIHSTTYVRKNGKNILCRGGIVKAYFILKEMAERLRAEIRKYRESADRSEKTFFFLFSPKEPIWLAIFGNDIKRFDFLFVYSKFAKPENSATVPSTAAMRHEIWHMFNTLVRTHQTLSFTQFVKHLLNFTWD